MRQRKEDREGWEKVEGAKEGAKFLIFSRPQIRTLSQRLIQANAFSRIISSKSAANGHFIKDLTKARVIYVRSPAATARPLAGESKFNSLPPSQSSPKETTQPHKKPRQETSSSAVLSSVPSAAAFVIAERKSIGATITPSAQATTSLHPLLLAPSVDHHQRHHRPASIQLQELRAL